MKNCRRVTWEDRLQIKAFLDSGVLPTVIADKLDFDKSTIWGYRPKQAAKDDLGIASHDR